MSMSSAAGSWPVVSEVLTRVGGDSGRRLLVFGYDQMEVAPVDAEIVAGTVEDVLVARADGEDVLGRGLVAGVDDLFGGIVDGDDGIDVEQHGNVMRCAVGRLRRPGEVGHRARENIEIAEDGRREEGEMQVDARSLELIERMRGRDGARDLLHAPECRAGRGP